MRGTKKCFANSLRSLKKEGKIPDTLISGLKARRSCFPPHSPRKFTEHFVPSLLFSMEGRKERVFPNFCLLLERRLNFPPVFLPLPKEVLSTYY